MWRAERWNSAHMVAIPSVLVLAALASACGAGTTGTSQPSPSSTAAKVPASTVLDTPVESFPTPLGPGTVAAAVSVDLPEGMTLADGYVWVAGHHSSTVTKIDPRTNQVVASIGGLGYQSFQPVWTDGSLWVPSTDYLARLNLTTGMVTSKLDYSTNAVASDGASVWAATFYNRLLRVDPKSARVLADIKLGPRKPGPDGWLNGLTIGFGSVWVGDGVRHRVLRIDPATNRISAVIHAGLGTADTPALLAAGAGALWVSSGMGHRSVLFRIDPRTNEVVRRITVGTDFQADWGYVCVGGGSVWVGNQDQTLVRVDPRSNRVTATYPLVGGAAEGVFYGFGSVWVGQYGASRVLRIDP